MTDDLISQIQSFTLAARGALEAEAAQQLEGIYGWLPDGAFANPKGYPAIAHIDEARETRSRLEQFAEDEKVAGLDAKSARRKLIRETAFTWLNRLAAFRLMEERKLLKQTIVRLAQSNGFIFWLTDEKTPQGQQAYALHQQGALPLNAMGEGPSDIAYRRFLLWQCGELARDVSVLFDPGTVASRLCPRPPLLKQLVTDMNAAELADAWKTGNEETIGWIYQAFNAEELQAAFAGAREQGKKFEAEDIPAVTQLFTIRWVVRFLVENTLGRLWVEMHPDSRLKDSLGCLVPVENTQKRPLKLAREISFLDPCCGSMHFGLVAFDIFVEMYREEIEHAGQPGWPAKASVATAEEIPASIIANNLHGIDLDLRAVQLSALTLLLRARTLNPKCTFTDENLASANVEEITGGRLEEFIKQAKFTHPIYERILRALAARLKDSNNLGSLLRLEKDLERLIAEERRKAEVDQQFALGFPGLKTESFKTQAGLDEFFDILTDQVLRHLDGFVQSSRTQGNDPGHFVSETAKGLRFMRVIRQRFDVVTTNPPYLSGRKMNKRLAALMTEEYKESKGDLYAAFVVRSQELLNESGLLGMLTMHSFMFISSYENMRVKLLKEVAIEAMAHFGGGLFAVGNPGTLQTAAFILRREPDESRRDDQAGVYFRLVNEPDADCKRRAFESALASSNSRQTHPLVFSYVQKEFDAIPGKPWVYWLTAGIRNCFAKLPNVGSLCSPVAGLRTSDNKRFLRFWWEVGVSNIDRSCRSRADADKSSKRWFPYMKGGRLQRWYGNQDYVIDWLKDGAQVSQAILEAYPYLGRTWLGGHQFYFNEGITWSDLSSSRFAARHSPGGFVFDVKGSSAFPKEIHLLLGVLNSGLAHVFLNMLNPTISYQVGDIERLPVPRGDVTALESKVKEALVLSKQENVLEEKAFEFFSPHKSLSDFQIRREKLRTIESQVDAEASQLYALSPQDLALIQQELAQASALSDETADAKDLDADSDAGEVVEDFDEGVTLESVAVNWLSYAFGTVLGRFQIGVPGGLGCGDFPANVVAEIRKLVDADGIMASDEDHPQDIVKRVLACLELMLGRAAAHAAIRTATGGDGDPEELLRDWIGRQFWKYHHQLHRKRPVYWPLQSPKKKFTVWVFHEQFSKDTLFRVKDQFVQVKINWLNGRIKDLKPKVLSSDTRDRRAAEKEISQLSDVLDDVQEFAERLKRTTERGYTPHIDDGVLLNAAPLWELLPAWKDAEKAWEELEAGDYDWAQQAMEYWPDRVKKACQTNKSFAIAHGLA